MLACALASCGAPQGRSGLGPLVPATTVNRPVVWTIESAKDRADPFNEIDLDVLVTAPDGTVQRVPAFWAGGKTWRVRYSSGQAGEHRYRTVCSDPTDAGLHNREGMGRVYPVRWSDPQPGVYTSTKLLLRHGPVHVAADKKHFEHADGTPFLWLADTWWMGLCKRIAWPEEFRWLAEDRVKKGFTVVQIVAGLYPDMPAFDERGANEAGFPWEKDYARINPAYFDAADRRIAHLVDAGLAPCIVGAWGYHLPWLGVERMKKHWRYLVARWGAYPVFWCLAGEGAMPYYLAKDKGADAAFQKKGWTEIARYVREIDPYHRPISIHPTDMSRTNVEDPSVLDFEMLQTGHGDRASIPNTVEKVRASRTAAPTMPTINSEVCYEGILGTCPAEVERFMAWTCLLSGTAGHTYGANGIWQLNRKGQPYGKSPHGGDWGQTPWDEAARLPGSGQTGLAAGLLRRFEWWRFEPHREWASYAAEPKNVRWGDWIWFPEGDSAKDAPAEARYFRRVFDLPASPKSAVLRMAADDRCEGWLNGEPVGKRHGWQPPGTFDVAARLRPGRNVLAIRAENTGGPAGLMGSLEVAFGDGTKMEVLTDASWQAAKTEDGKWKEPEDPGAGWSTATVIGKAGDAPWGNLASSDPYMVPYSAGIPGQVRVMYLPLSQPVVVHGLEPGVRYRASWFDPVTGTTSDAGAAAGDAKGDWKVPPVADGSPDRVLVLDAL